MYKELKVSDSDVVACEMPDCNGMLGGRSFPIQTGCSSSTLCRSCMECGRVHAYNGGLMFRRRGEALYLRNDTIELVMEPVSFEVGETYLSKGYLYVCLEDKEVDEDIPEMDDVDPETPLIYDGTNTDNMFRFHGPDGTKYLLDRGDVNFIKKKQ